MNFYEAYKESEQFKSDINARIEENLSIFNGEPYGNEVEGRSKIVWKLIKKQALTLSANLSKPFITGTKIVDLKPTTKNDVIKAKLDEKLINHFYKYEFDYINFIKTLSNVLVKEGTVFIKTSWIQEKKKMNIDGKEFSRVIKNRPFAEVVPNEDVYTDPLAYTIEDSRFIIIKTLVSENDLRENPLFDNAKINELFEKYDKTISEQNDIHNRNLSYISQDDDEKQDIEKKCFVYEYWYREAGSIKLKYYASINDMEPIQMKATENLDIQEYPFIAIQLFKKEFSIWGMGLPEIIDDEQKFMTAIVRGVIDNMSLSNNGTKFIKKGSLDSKNFERLVSGSPVVEINSTASLRDVMIDGNFNELPASVYNLLSIIENQAEGLTGVTRSMQGISGKDINAPATNFSAIVSQAQIRLLDFSINIRHGLSKMFFKWLKMIYKYLSDEEIYKITGIDIPELKTKETMKLLKEFGIINESGEPQVGQDTYNKAVMLVAKEVEDIFNKDDVIYDINMEVGTDGIKQIKIQEINMLLQQLLPLVGSNMIPQKMVNIMMSKMFELLEYPDVAEEIKNYKPQIDPMQQQIAMAQAQVEIAQGKAKAMKEEALAQNALARTKMTEVKAQKEAIKADPEIAKEYLEIKEKLDDKKGEADRVNKE